MSRIEKAIEGAVLKRGRGPQDIPAKEKPAVQQEEDKSAPSPQYGKGIATNLDNPFLVTASEQKSPAAEQYRKLKSLIVQLSHLGHLDKSLMVTSAVAGEGKTITSLNLAMTLAQEFDHTVLLVEADIRKPSILKHLGIEAPRGLVDCVLDGTDIGEVLVKTDLGNLSVLPAGRPADNPVEIFSSNRMSQLFEEIQNRYRDRYVIVDTTPLLLFAEPQYIAKAIGAVLLVVREGVTKPDDVKRSLEIIKNNTLLGVVNNCVSHVSSRDGYYGGYYGYR